MPIVHNGMNLWRRGFCTLVHSLGLSVCLFVCAFVGFSLKLLCCRARALPELYGCAFSPPLISACAFCDACAEGSALQCIHLYKCKKHFIKMLKDVGMVVPKIKETRL